MGGSGGGGGGWIVEWSGQRVVYFLKNFLGLSIAMQCLVL